MNILQCSADLDFSTVIYGHSEEFWALSCHPQMHQFLTAGQDRLVIMWDSLSKQVIWCKNMGESIHCAEFYPHLTINQDFHGSNMTKSNNQIIDENNNNNDNYDPNSGMMISPHRLLVTLGTSTGRWLVLDCLTQQIIVAFSDGVGEQIECLSYSPGNF